jgi:hypothetical protein
MIHQTSTRIAEKESMRNFGGWRGSKHKWFGVGSLVLLIILQSVWFVYVFRDLNRRLVDFRVYDIFLTAKLDGYSPYGIGKSTVNTIALERWSISAERLPIQGARQDENIMRFHYSPFFFFVFRPLALLSPIHAAMAWFVLSCIAFDVTALLLSKWRSDGWLDPFCLILTAVFVPVLQTLSAGQINGFVLLALVIGLFLAGNEQEVAGGGALSVALLLKPLPVLIALLLYFLFRRRGKLLVWTGIWFGVSFVLISLFEGVLPWLDYARNLFSFGREFSFSFYVEDTSLWTLLGRNMSRSLAMIAGAILSMGIVAWSAYCIWSNRKGKQWIDIALVIVVVTLVSTISPLHYSVFVLIPITLLLSGTGMVPNLSRGGRLWVLAAIALFELQGLVWQRFAEIPLLSAWATVALVILLLVLSWHYVLPLQSKTGVEPSLE